LSSALKDWARVELKMLRRLSLSTSQKLLLETLLTLVLDVLPAPAAGWAVPLVPPAGVEICPETLMLEEVLRERLT